MEVVPTEQKNVRRAIQTGIGDALRSYYADVLNERVPSRVTDLLGRLDEIDESHSEKREARINLLPIRPAEGAKSKRSGPTNPFVRLEE